MFLPIRQRSRSAFREIAQPQGPYGDAEEAQHTDSQLRQHASDMAILAFVEDNFEPGIFFTTAKNLHTLGPQETVVVSPDTLDDGFKQCGVRDRANLDVIDFVDMRLGREHTCRPLRIIGQQQQAFARFVQTSDGCDPRQVFVQISIHRFASLFVGRRRHHATRLVEHQVNLRPGREFLAIYFDPIVF